jgi:cytoskeletal protein CcmA (bactofilin family)
MESSKSGEFAHIGKSVVIKGELSGSEDLYIDGTVDGTIELRGNNLVIGANGQVRGSVNGKSVVVQGKLEGNVQASERTELRKTATLVGDIFTHRIAIEEGAYLKGKVDVQKDVTTAASSSGKSSTTSAPGASAGSTTSTQVIKS